MTAAAAEIEVVTNTKKAANILPSMIDPAEIE